MKQRRLAYASLLCFFVATRLEKLSYMELGSIADVALTGVEVNIRIYARATTE